MGDAEIPKAGAAVIVRLTDAVPLRLPEVPVMVTTAVPSEAELAAFSCNVLLLVVLAGVKDAVTPVGRPVALRATAAVNPFCGVMEIVLFPPVPCAMLRLVGDAAIVNAGGPVTVSDSCAVLVRLPEVPVIVMADVDETAVLLAVSVRVLVVAAVAGLNDAVTPAGRPDAVRFTELLKPFCPVIAIVLLPLVPARIASVDADVARAKDCAPVLPVKLLMSGWPAGLPHPVARS